MDSLTKPFCVGNKMQITLCKHIFQLNKVYVIDWEETQCIQLLLMNIERKISVYNSTHCCNYSKCSILFFYFPKTLQKYNYYIMQKLYLFFVGILIFYTSSHCVQDPWSERKPPQKSALVFFLLKVYLFSLSLQFIMIGGPGQELWFQVLFQTLQEFPFSSMMNWRENESWR
jgi:hypothetical protein